MALEWIKMRHDLSEDSSVIAIAESLGIDEDLVVGKLHRLWSWADKNTTDGTIQNVSVRWVNKKVGIDGFAEAMASEEWLTIGDGFIHFPNFDRHNGESAKKRAEDMLRKRKERVDGSRTSRGQKSDKQRTERGNPEDQERERDLEVEIEEEEKKEVNPPSGDMSTDEPSTPATTTDFLNSWNATASEFGLRKCVQLNDERKRHIRARLNDQFWRDHWRQALAKVRGSPFCQGKNDRGWRADIDWFLRPKTVAKLIEGTYDDDKQESVF